MLLRNFKILVLAEKSLNPAEISRGEYIISSC